MAIKKRKKWKRVYDFYQKNLVYFTKSLYQQQVQLKSSLLIISMLIKV